MKKRVILLSLISSICVLGCSNGISSNNSNNSTNINQNNSSEYSDYEENNSKDAVIQIEYYYKNGQLDRSIRERKKVGETYKYISPEINFMKPDCEEVEVQLTKDGFYKRVTYDYSYEKVHEVNYGDSFSSFMVDESRGISFNYTISGNTSHWDPVFESDEFVIYNAYLRAQGENYTVDFKSSSVINSNNSVNDELLTSKDNEIFVSISVNADHSISMYKNGVLKYTWVASMLPVQSSYSNGESVKYIKDLVNNIFEGISDDGFRIGSGNYKIKDLSIGYGLTDDEAQKLYKKNVHTQIKYIDEFDNEIFESKSIIDEGGTSYSFTSPKLSHYLYNEKVEGTTNISQVRTVKYTFDGNEKITNDIIQKKKNVLNQKNITDWRNENAWFNISNQIEGDFIVRLNYHLNGIASKHSSTNYGDSNWRTNLTIIQNPNNKDRFVSRLDCHGWMDDLNGDGRQIGSDFGFTSLYFDNNELDCFNVYNDCIVTETIERKGNTITLNHIIKPQKTGYTNRVYKFTSTLNNVNTNKVNIFFAAEDAVVTINSLKIKDL